MCVVGRPFPLELEDDHPAVVAGREQILLWVSGEDPEAVVLSTERLYSHALANVPHLHTRRARAASDREAGKGREGGRGDA